MRLQVLVLAEVLGSSASGLRCFGEFQLCPGSDCALDASLCSGCRPGEYRCPLGTDCATGPDLTACELDGTHFDTSLDLESRMDFLSRSVSLEEKAAQLTSDSPALLRLGIPAYSWVDDDLHGVRNDSYYSVAAVFPDGCGLGATWSSELVASVAEAIGYEARAIHNDFVGRGFRTGYNGWGITAYAPNINLVRDPRWGRAQEVFGEDPLLAARFGAAYVTGMQGQAAGPHTLVAATCKHFAAYDVERVSLRGQWRQLFNAIVDDRNLLESYLPAFEACVAAGAEQVMCGYNLVNGVPACASQALLNKTLRGQWGFRGSVVSDFDSWASMVDTQHFVQNYTSAAALGLNAGLDQEGGGTKVVSTLPQAVALGLTSAAQVDLAFRRLFRTRIRLGMFDPPSEVPFNTLTLDEHLGRDRQLAVRATRESLCLYKNRGGVLPLDAKSSGRVAVVGPGAVLGQLLLGNYMEPGVEPADIDRILSGIGRYMGEGADFLAAVQKCGDDAAGNDLACSELVGSAVHYAAGCESVECPDQSLFAAAEAAARGAGATIVVLGLRYDSIGNCLNCTVETPPENCSVSGCESEGFDRISLDLPPNQYALVRRLRLATTGPLIGIFVHGGVFSLKNLNEDLDAMLDAWYPGAAAGEAISDVLFGRYSPAGRTAVTWYQSTDDLPADRSNASWYTPPGYSYRFFQGPKADIALGHGLSYSTFAYEDGSAPMEVDGCDALAVRVTLRNAGPVDSDEVVQVYVRPLAPQLPQPRVRLVDFRRLFLPRGATEQLEFQIEPRARAVVLNGEWASEAGDLEIWVGGGQPGLASGWGQVVRVRSSGRLIDCPQQPVAYV